MSIRPIFSTSPLFLLLFSLSLPLYAQKGQGCPDDLFPKLGENRQWGYVNMTGQWVVEPFYTKVSPHVQSRAIVQKGLLYGVIDCEGNVIISPQYERMTNFRYGKVWAMKGGKWGLIGEKNKVFLEHQYTEINPIADTELSWVKTGDLWGLLNEANGRFICNPKYKIAQIMSDSTSLVKTNQKFGVIHNYKCTYIIPEEIDRVKKLAPHDIIFLQNGKWGLFNDKGKILAKAEYDTLFMNYQEVLTAKKDGAYGLLSLTGKKILTTDYEEISNYSEGLFMVKQKGKYGYCNRSGKVFIKPQYETATPFKNKKAVVSKDKLFGIIDYTNKPVLPVKFLNIRQHSSGYYYAVQKEATKANPATRSYYLYDKNGKEISTTAFDDINTEDSLAYTRVQNQGKIRYYNVQTGNYLSTEPFDDASSFRLGYALVVQNNKKGILDEQGKLVLPCQYESIDVDFFQSKLVFSTVLNGKYGIVETNGKTLIPNEYDLIATALPNYLKAKKNGKYGILRTSGAAVGEFAYDYMSNSRENPGTPEWPAMVAVNGKYGLLNEKGEYVTEPKAKAFKYLGERIYASQHKSWNLISSTGAVTETKYSQIDFYGEGLAGAQLDGKWGYITLKGEERIKCQYEEITAFIEKMAVVKSKGKYGVIDKTGKWLINPEYDSFSQSEGQRKLTLNGQTYTLMEKGILK